MSVYHPPRRRAMPAADAKWIRDTIVMHNNGSDELIFIQGHSHSEPVCAWPDCNAHLTRLAMATLRRAGDV